MRACMPGRNTSVHLHVLSASSVAESLLDVEVPWCWWEELLCDFLVRLCREGATLSGRMCAYKILDAAPELARSKQKEPAMALA